MHTNAWLGTDHFTIVSPLNFENPYSRKYDGQTLLLEIAHGSGASVVPYGTCTRTSWHTSATVVTT